MLGSTMTLSGSLICSSILLSGAGFSASFFLIQAIFSRDEERIKVWHREHARWQRLERTSGLFRAMSHWIIGVSQLVERRLGWFVSIPTASSRSTQFRVTLFRWCFGDSNRLRQAVRVGNAIEPWSPSEIVAIGFLFASMAGILTTLSQGDRLLTPATVAKTLGVWLISYRIWCFHVISRSAKRQRAIRQFLPHAMDSISMVMSAGGTFSAGIETVIQDFPAHPLSSELRRLRNDLQRGQTMAQSLMIMRHSICLPEVDELAQVLGRVHQHGVSASEHFIGMAKQLRTNHLRIMEDQVGRAEALMSLPTMLVMLSCMLVASAPFVLSLLSSAWID